MNQFITDTLQLDRCRQTVFHIALAQQVQPVLIGSMHYDYAVRTLSLCWNWVEKHDVNGIALYHLYHDDDDHGVETAMYAAYSHNPAMWNAWGCVSGALVCTGYCAFLDQGDSPPESFEDAFSEKVLTAFMGYYHGVVGESQVPEQLTVFLRGLPDNQITKSVILAKLGELVNFSTTKQ